MLNDNVRKSMVYLPEVPFFIPISECTVRPVIPAVVHLSLVSFKTKQMHGNKIFISNSLIHCPLITFLAKPQGRSYI